MNNNSQASMGREVFEDPHLSIRTAACPGSEFLSIVPDTPFELRDRIIVIDGLVSICSCKVQPGQYEIIGIREDMTALLAVDGDHDYLVATSNFQFAVEHGLITCEI